MVGFHDVDGVPMHHHHELIRGLLKNEWGFPGVVISDWDGIGQLVHQGVATDLRDAARQAMLAGVDLDMMSGAYRDHLPGLIESGDIGIDLLDDAVRRSSASNCAPDSSTDRATSQAGPQATGCSPVRRPTARRPRNLPARPLHRRWCC